MPHFSMLVKPRTAQHYFIIKGVEPTKALAVQKFANQVSNII